MKHLQFAFFIIFLFIFSFQSAIAQQHHFIYIQTENKQPFYVKLDTKVYSSSASGYLLIPKLKDGTYNLAIGFPKSEWTEQNLVCTVDKNDIGYLLKNFGTKGWGLFNFQTLAVVYPTEKEKADAVEVVNQTDAFSNMLSNVVNDSTIRQTETVKEEVKKAPAVSEEKMVQAATNTNSAASAQAAIQSPAVVIPVAVAEKQTKSNTGANKIIEDTDPTKQTVSDMTDSRSAITRSLFSKNEAGTEMIYIDKINGKMDTIRVFIPAEINTVAIAEEEPKEVKPTKSETKSELPKQEEKVKDTKFLDIELPNPNQTAPLKPTVENKEKNKVESAVPAGKYGAKDSPNVVMINSDCRNFASDEDFLKLRKKMAAEDNDDDMIAVARKVFKSRCFTVEQVKNLSVLFLKDAGKYSFFDVVYPFVSDSHNYSTLQGQLSETYYINRFQVMIRH